MNNNISNIIHPLSNVGMGLETRSTFQVWLSGPSTPHPLSDIHFGK